MITELRVSNWRCLKDTTLALTPLHALIGPNDSGKSTLLQALFHALRPVGEVFEHALTAGRVRTDCDPQRKPIRIGRIDDQSVPAELAIQELGEARKLHLEPERMRQPSGLLTPGQFSLHERGYELPGIYDAILNRNRDAWDHIEASVRDGFPTVRRLTLLPINESKKVLEIELLDGTRVPAAQMSEGLLYWLAFAALPYVNPAKLLLIEEPENGLHPARIAEVVRVLRRVVENGTQVVLATHSPLVVNELQPEEVSVVTRTAEEGTRVRRVSALPDLDRLLSAFSLGELWLAFADGIEESGLFESREGEVAAS